MERFGRGSAEVKSALFRWIGAHHGSPPLRRVADVADGYLRAYWNQNFNLRRNGELHVINALVGGRTVTVFDVGAHVGGWSAAVRAAAPDAAIHTFEILEAHRAALRRRFASDTAIVLNDFGLAGAEMHREVVPADSMTSVMRRALPREVTETVTLTTGDRYIEASGITGVELVKVDVEGMDLDVLRGFAGSLAEGAIRAVQCEVNLWRIPAHATFADFYELLESHGLVVGWIFPRRVEFLSYDAQMERVDGINLIAVAVDDRAARRALSGE